MYKINNKNLISSVKRFFAVGAYENLVKAGLLDFPVRIQYFRDGRAHKTGVASFWYILVVVARLYCLGIYCLHDIGMLNCCTPRLIRRGRDGVKVHPKLGFNV